MSGGWTNYVWKTFFVKRFLEALPQMVNTTIKDIIWCYGELQPCYETLKRQGIRFVQGPIDSDTPLSYIG
jgi:hypothetical protein